MLTHIRTAIPTKNEPITAQPKKNKDASIHPRALVDKYIAKKTKKINNSYNISSKYNISIIFF